MDINVVEEEHRRPYSVHQIPPGLAVASARRAHQNFPVLYNVASFPARYLFSRWWCYKFEKAGIGSGLQRLDAGRRRSSDTVFVMGTGSSLSTYDPSYWNIVKRHDSIGLNYFILHDLVPTFYFAGVVNSTLNQIMEIRYSVVGDYQDVPLIMKDQIMNFSQKRVSARSDDFQRLHPQVRSSVYFPADFLVPGTNIAQLGRSYDVSRRLGFWRPRNRFSALTKKRGSVSLLINFAVRMGYKRIVLCGIDLNHSDHFYDQQRESLLAKGWPVPVRADDESGEVHRTNDPEISPLTIRDVLLTIKERVLDRLGIEIFVGSKASALYPDIPYFEWAKEIECAQ